jgi:hypothetical protein
MLPRGLLPRHCLRIVLISVLGEGEAPLCFPPVSSYLVLLVVVFEVMWRRKPGQMAQAKDNVRPQMTLVREAGLSTVVGGQLSECCTTAVPFHYKTRGSLEGLLRYGRHSCQSVFALMAPCDPPLSYQRTGFLLEVPAKSASSAKPLMVGGYCFGR